MILSDDQIAVISSLLHHQDGHFAELVGIAGLDPTKDFRDADLTNVDFAISDLQGYDFSGADLSGADLRNAEIAGAKFHCVACEPGAMFRA